MTRMARSGAGRSMLVHSAFVRSRNIMAPFTVPITDFGGRRLELEFSRQLNENEMANLQNQLSRWRSGAYDLNTALILADLFPDRVVEIAADSRKEVNPSHILGRSFVEGRARSFLYHQSGLLPNTLSALEIALFRKSRKPFYNPRVYFDRAIQEPDQRAMAMLVFGRLHENPAHELFEAGAAEISMLSRDIADLHRQRAAFRQAERSGEWNIAEIRSREGVFLIRIPKEIAPEPEFRRLVAHNAPIDKFIQVFGLLYVTDLMLQKLDHGVFRLLDAQERSSISSIRPANMHIL